MRKVKKDEKTTSFLYFCLFGLLRAKLLTVCYLTSWSQITVGYLYRERFSFFISFFPSFLVFPPLFLLKRGKISFLAPVWETFLAFSNCQVFYNQPSVVEILFN